MLQRLPATEEMDECGNPRRHILLDVPKGGHKGRAAVRRAPGDNSAQCIVRMRTYNARKIHPKSAMSDIGIMITARPRMMTSRRSSWMW